VSAATVYGLCSKTILRHIRVSNCIRIPETSISEMRFREPSAREN